VFKGSKVLVEELPPPHLDEKRVLVATAY